MAKVQKLPTPRNVHAHSAAQKGPQGTQNNEPQYTRYGRRYLDCWNIVDRDDGKRSIWTKLGFAFENRDGSWNVELTAFPANMKLHLRNPSPRTEQAPEAA